MMAREHGAARPPLPAWIEAQRKAALITLQGAEKALELGDISNARTLLMMVTVYLLAMAPEDMTATAPGTEDRTEEPTR